MTMRDEDDAFDNCEDWSEATFIRRFATMPSMRGPRPYASQQSTSASLIFDLAIQGKVADIQRVISQPRQPGQTMALDMPQLFSTIGLLEETWKARAISFGEAIRGLFTIREVVQNLERGRIVDPSKMHFFGAGLMGVADGEAHDFGLQIAAEKLYVSGWRTEVDVKGGFDWMIARARAQYFDFAGVSVGCDESLACLADRIGELRDVSRNRAIYVIVGGAVFAYSDNCFDFLGADCVARTADEATSYLNGRLKVTRFSRSH